MFTEVKVINTLEGETDVKLYKAIDTKTMLQDLSVSVHVLLYVLKALCHHINCTCYYFKFGDIHYRHAYVVTFHTLRPC